MVGDVHEGGRSDAALRRLVSREIFMDARDYFRDSRSKLSKSCNPRAKQKRHHSGRETDGALSPVDQCERFDSGREENAARQGRPLTRSVVHQCPKSTNITSWLVLAVVVIITLNQVAAGSKAPPVISHLLGTKTDARHSIDERREAETKGSQNQQSTRYPSRQDDIAGKNLTGASSDSYQDCKPKEKIGWGKGNIARQRGDGFHQQNAHDPAEGRSNDQPPREQPSERDREPISRLGHDRPTKIDRGERPDGLANPIKHVCGDCLAIPMVALVGKRQLNGFIIQSAPSNLHGENPASAAHLANEQSRRVRNNDKDANFNNVNGQMDQIHYQGYLGRPPRSAARWQPDAQQQGPYAPQQPPPLVQLHTTRDGQKRYSPAGTGADYNSRAAPLNYPSGPYGTQAPSHNPFKPVSDERCPMVGPLTVCDQIGSYPADAILHKLDTLKQALHKSYFNVDSLFSDESDGLTDPFETPTSTRAASSVRDMSRLVPLMDSAMNHSNYAAGGQYPRPGSGEPGYKTAALRAGTKILSEEPRANLAMDGESSGYSRSEGRRKQTRDGQKKRPDIKDDSFDDEDLSEKSIAQGRQQNFSHQEHRARDGPRIPELKMTPNDKFLYLVERKGLNGIAGTIHNLRADRQLMENLKESGAHKIDATNFPASEDVPTAAASSHDGDNHQEKVLGHELPHKVTLPASGPSVESGHRGGVSVVSKRHRRAATTLGQTQAHKRLSASAGRVLSTGETLAPHDPGSLANTAVQPRGGAMRRSGSFSPQEVLTSKTPRTLVEVGNGRAKNNQGLHRGQRLDMAGAAGGHGAKSTNSLSAPLPPAPSGTKVLTTEDSSEAEPNSVQRQNLSSSATFPPAQTKVVVARGSAADLALQSKGNPMNPQTKLTRFGRDNTPASIPCGLDTQRTNCRNASATANTSKRVPMMVSTRRRRQAPVPVKPSSEPDAPGVGDSTPTGEGTDPSEPPSSSDAEQAAVARPICRAKSIYISPRAALNDKKQWKYVVNAPERDPRIKQIIRVDVCEAPFEPCSGDVTLPLGFTSQCKQKYAKKKLLALDSQSGLLEVDTFFIPSCCVCQLVADRQPFSEGGDAVTPLDENMQ